VKQGDQVWSDTLQCTWSLTLKSCSGKPNQLKLYWVSFLSNYASLHLIHICILDLLFLHFISLIFRLFIFVYYAYCVRVNDIIIIILNNFCSLQSCNHLNVKQLHQFSRIYLLWPVLWCHFIHRLQLALRHQCIRPHHWRAIKPQRPTMLNNSVHKHRDFKLIGIKPELVHQQLQNVPTTRLVSTVCSWLGDNVWEWYVCNGTWKGLALFVSLLSDEYMIRPSRLRMVFETFLRW